MRAIASCRFISGLIFNGLRSIAIAKLGVAKRQSLISIEEHIIRDVTNKIVESKK